MHIYENRSLKPVTVVLPTADNTRADQYIFGPFGRLELNYPGLDGYVPHLLTKVCHESGILLLTTSATTATVAPVVVTMSEPEVVVAAPVIVEDIIPVVVEAPVVEEAPKAEEAPVVEDAPAEEAPVVEEKPVAKTTRKKK